MRMDKISFGAKPINTINIKKFDKRANNFINCQATFVKLDPKNSSDISAVGEAAATWKDSKYASKIATAACWMNKNPIVVYALTIQKDKFNKLVPEKILGLAEMRKDNRIPDEDFLYHLQVKPDAINVDSDGKNNYKYVGSSILKSLKKLYSNIFLFSEISPNIQKFYMDNGFIRDYMYERRYHWSSDVLKRLKYHLENIKYKLGI